MVDLHECVNELEKWHVGKAVILKGAGKTFCSGGELNSVNKILENGNDMCELMQNTTSRIFDLPMVSVAAVSGHALGGGAELTTCCDFRLVTENAKIGFVQARMNVATGWGGCTRLVKLVGRTHALHLLTSGKVLNCSEATHIGLVNGVISSDNVEAAAKEWVSQNCVGTAEVTRVIKKMVLSGMYLEESQAYDMERSVFCRVWGMPSHQDALKANIKHK